MAFPTKADRQKCYDSRDQYWNCLLVNEENQQKCLKQRKLFESDCPAQWVKHFDRKRNYTQFKEKFEKEGELKSSQEIIQPFIAVTNTNTTSTTSTTATATEGINQKRKRYILPYKHSNQPEYI